MHPHAQLPATSSSASSSSSSSSSALAGRAADLGGEGLAHDHVGINDQHIVLLHIVLGQPGGSNATMGGRLGWHVTGSCSPGERCRPASLSRATARQLGQQKPGRCVHPSPVDDGHRLVIRGVCVAIARVMGVGGCHVGGHQVKVRSLRGWHEGSTVAGKHHCAAAAEGLDWQQRVQPCQLWHASADCTVTGSCCTMHLCMRVPCARIVTAAHASHQPSPPAGGRTPPACST